MQPDLPLAPKRIHSVIKSLEHGGLYWDFGVLNIFERVHQVLKFSKKFNEV